MLAMDSRAPEEKEKPQTPPLLWALCFVSCALSLSGWFFWWQADKVLDEASKQLDEASKQEAQALQTQQEARALLLMVKALVQPYEN